VKKYLLICLLTVFGWSAQTFVPVGSIEINGTVKDMVLHGDDLVIATDMGHIEVYDTLKKEKIKEISIPDVKDFMGDVMPARVMSTDTLNGTYLLLSIKRPLSKQDL